MSKAKQHIVHSLFIFFILSMPLAAIFSKDNKSASSGFLIESLSNNLWEYNGKLHYSYLFENKSIGLNLNSRQKTELRIRITQLGNSIDAAHIDYLALKARGMEVVPDSVADLTTGQDILYKVSKPDHDVADARGHVIEAVWKNINAEKASLLINAREESIKTLPGVPFLLPRSLNTSDHATFLSYNPRDNGKIDVDGKINGKDSLGAPDFSFYTVPISGHPAGFVYVYIKKDNDYLYIAQDITSDNTLDKDDWSIVYLYTNEGLKEFKINSTDSTYGISGFGYTKEAAYEHKIFEFRIPISDAGMEYSPIKIGFRFYGTAGEGGGGAEGSAGGAEGGESQGGGGAEGTGSDYGYDSGGNLVPNHYCGDGVCGGTVNSYCLQYVNGMCTDCNEYGCYDYPCVKCSAYYDNCINYQTTECCSWMSEWALACGPCVQCTAYAKEDCDTCPQDCGSCCAPNTGQPCGNCGTINCAGSCINQGPCSPGQTQCSGTRYQTCNSGCQWQNSGIDADGDGTDAQCGDSLCDNSPGVFDSTKTATETACTDNLDNDCDVKTDCSDNDCDGSITGNVKNQNNKFISEADVSAKKGLATVNSAATNSQGIYTISPINCGTYNLIASHADYVPREKSDIFVNPQQQRIVNFDGESSLVLGTSCENDCTYFDDNIVHASCDGQNSCAFYDSIARAACDNSQPGWVRDYNSTHYVVCASGSPQPKIEIAASVTCESGTLVKVTRIVFYNGKPVKLVVAACG